jgi:hypothetical protein
VPSAWWFAYRITKVAKSKPQKYRLPEKQVVKNRPHNHLTVET